MSIPVPFYRGLAPLLLALAALPAGAQQGLQVGDSAEAWPRWQARVGITLPEARPYDAATPPLARMPGAQLMGDYYFTGPGFGAGHVAGGFRATSGLMIGPRTRALSALALPNGSGLSVHRAGPDAGEASSTVPYVGVGYSSLSLRGGWGFSADFGLMALGGGLRVQPGAASQLDDAVREMRLSPVLQLGVSYAF